MSICIYYMHHVCLYQVTYKVYVHLIHPFTHCLCILYCTIFTILQSLLNNSIRSCSMDAACVLYYVASMQSGTCKIV